MTKAEQAAREYAKEEMGLCRCAGFTCSGCELKTNKFAYLDFLAGIQWCRENELKIAVDALEAVKGKETMCIYGSTAMDECNDQQQVFQLGSNMAWVETAEIAREALDKIARGE